MTARCVGRSSGFMSRKQLPQHVAEAEHGIDLQPVRLAVERRQRVIGAENVARAVDQEDVVALFQRRRWQRGPTSFSGRDWRRLSRPVLADFDAGMARNVGRPARDGNGAGGYLSGHPSCAPYRMCNRGTGKIATMRTFDSPLPIDDALPASDGGPARRTAPPSWSRRPAPARRRACRWCWSTRPGCADNKITRAGAATARGARRGGPHGGDARRTGRRHRGSARALRLQGVARDPHRGRHRRHLHPA